MNPDLGLRCATSPWVPDSTKFAPSTADDLRERIEGSPPSEYLVYAGTDLDVVTIAMPQPPDDDMMSGFTEVNREW